MPKRQYQDYLDVVTRALLDGDLATMLRHVALPFMISTRSYRVVVTCTEELDLFVSDLRALLVEHKVTLYRRTCIEARFVDASRNTIIGTHLTEAFTDDGPAMPGNTGSMALLRIDGVWKAIWLDSRVNDNVVAMLSEDVSKAQAKTRLISEMSSHPRRYPKKGSNQ
jgi:hypothetical protein